MTEMVTSGSMSGVGKRGDGLLGESDDERRRSHLAPPVLYATALLFDSTDRFLRSTVILGHVTAGLLDSRRALSASACRFIPFEQDRYGTLRLRSLSNELRHRNVLFVDYWRDPERGLAACTQLARAAGARILACALIGGWPGPARHWDIPVVTLCDAVRSCAVVASECPTCRSGRRPTIFLELVGTLRVAQEIHGAEADLQ